MQEKNDPGGPDMQPTEESTPSPHGRTMMPRGPRTARGAAPALVGGLLGVCLAFIPVLNLVAFIPAILAITYASRAIRECNQEPLLKGKAMAITALVLGGLVILYTLILLGVLFFIIGIDEFLAELRERFVASPWYA